MPSHKEPLAEHGGSALVDPSVQDRPDKRSDHEELNMLNSLTGRDASGRRNDEVQLDNDGVGVDRGMLAAEAPEREECLACHAGDGVEAD